MAIIQGNAKQGSTRGFYPKVINGSLRFNPDDTSYLTWTPDSAGSQTTWTFSCWLKKCALNAGEAYSIFGTGASNVEDTICYFQPGGESSTFDFIASRDSSTFRGRIHSINSTQFRDSSAWYHFVMVWDSTNANSADRVRLYINGVRQTSSTGFTIVEPSPNETTLWNSQRVHYIGKMRDNADNIFDGYMANVHFIDGQALTPSDFGSLKNGVWVAKNYAGTFGTNGFYLTFEDDTEVEAFNTVLYRGTGTAQSITGTGFAPDMIWIKERTSTSSHRIHDTVRGAQARLFPDNTNAESVSATSVSSFDSDGFTVLTDGGVNENNQTYVAWCWDAGANNASTGHSSVTWTGDSSTSRDITGFGFAPDFVWIKDRNTARGSVVFDVIRGQGNYLRTNETTQESTSATPILTAFNSDGFTLGNNAAVNNSNETYVAWGWDAGDGDPVSNTAGTITSTVKTNGDFSIISYQGTLADANIGHGLSSAPDMIIIKNRNRVAGTPWVVYHSALDASQRVLLNDTGSASSSGNIFGSTPTAPDATKFYVGNVNWVNNNVSGENDHIAYAWRNVTGKQKFGTYTGSTGNVTVNDVGFRPGFLLVKNTNSGTSKWGIVDGTRSPLGDTEASLYANDAGAEYTGNLHHIEFTSTGFIVKNTDDIWNTNGHKFIYAAFAGSYSDYITDYNTDGTNIDSRVKANQTTGFSIVSYEGSGTASDSFGHGLGTAPSMVIIKDRQLANSWLVQHSSVTGYLTLNSTNAVAGTDQLTFGASTVTLNGTWDIMNGSGRPYIAYCWSETTGVSKFGSYAGDSTTDGSNAINVGFKPALVMIKHYEDTAGTYNGDWFIYDNTRDVPDGDSYLRPNLSSAETANGGMLRLTDTGFALYTNSGSHNETNNNYIYAAFADTREAAFWLDQSGNDNDWQPVNLDHNDTVADSPTNNFATLNPLFDEASGHTFADGNLKVTTKTTGYGVSVATIVPTAGKFYAEIIPSTIASTLIGIRDVTIFGGNNAFVTQNDPKGLAYFSGGALYGTNVSTDSTGGASYASGDVIGVAINYDDGEVRWYKNGTIQYTKTGLDLTNMALAVGDVNNSSSSTMTANFGQQPFKYDPPA